MKTRKVGILQYGMVYGETTTWCDKLSTKLNHNQKYHTCTVLAAPNANKPFWLKLIVEADIGSKISERGS